MTEKREIRSVKDLLLENEALEARNDFLQRMANGLRLNNQMLTKERNDLIDELTSIKGMSMFEFGNKYGTEESLSEDGRAFARALLGGE